MKPFVLALALGTLLVGGPASAQVFGQFTGAETIPNGGRMFGGYVYSSDNVLGLLTQLRLSFYPNVDFGFQGGIARLNFAAGDRTTLRVGSGFKVKLSEGSSTMPLTSALGADLGIETGDSYNILTIEPSFIASRKFAMGDNSAVTPYGRIGLAITRIDIRDDNRSDLSLPLHLGSEFDLSSQLKIAIELQFRLSDDLNDNVALAGGVNIPF